MARCPICGEKDHKSPGSMTEKELYRHRITEDRDCVDYERCLTEAALANAVMVPCIFCKKFKRLH